VVGVSVNNNNLSIRIADFFMRLQLNTFVDHVEKGRTELKNELLKWHKK